MASSHRCCFNHPDIFCYICGSYTSKKQRKPISTVVKSAYFGVKVRDQNKQWALHVAGKTCVEHLRQWINGKRQSLLFGVPMVWKKPKNHSDNCYFCTANIQEINRNNIRKGTYEVHSISFQTFLVWTLLLTVHTKNSSPLQSILLRHQCTCCTVPTTSGKPPGSLLVCACLGPSSQPLSCPQLWNNDCL